MNNLSKEQQLVLDKIKLFIRKNGYSPSIRELCFFTDTNSPATIHYHLKNLREKGYITYQNGKNRTIRVLEEREEPIEVEIC